MKKLFIILLITFACLSVSAEDKIIKTFIGSDMKDTRPFIIPDNWEIQWDFKGIIIQIFVYDSDGDLVDVAANQIGSGSGASYQAKGGKYYIKINAIGEWAIDIIDIIDIIE